MHSRAGVPAFLLFGFVACGGGSDAAPPPNSTGDASTAPPNTSSEGGITTSPDGGDGRYVDSCNLQSSQCTAAPTGFAEGSGLAEVDRCAFALTESDGIATTSDVLTALAKITTPVQVADVLADANRTATKATTVAGNPTGVQYAFTWQDDDQSSVAWTPQGITGTADAFDTGKLNDKAAILISFYDDPPAGSTEANVGVRIAFVDTTVAVSPKYRFALLVQPGGSASAPTFAPVKIHAGGIVWYQNYLYIADTNHGFRVFDMQHILEVAVDPGNFGCTGTTCRAGTYKYVIPQVGTYSVGSSCSPIFSWVSLDRASNPPSLVSGEYCSTTACGGELAGRAFRWPLDPTTGLLRSKLTFPTEAYLMGQKQVQGGAAVNGVFYLSSSAPSADGGALYRVVKGKSVTSAWGNNPEDVMVDPGNRWLWNLNEKAGTRAVYGVSLSSYPAP